MVTVHGKFQGCVKKNGSGRSNQIPSPVVVNKFAIAPGDIRLPNSHPSS
jgi:hypothetical protein